MLCLQVSGPPVFFAVRWNLAVTEGNILSSCRDIYALPSVTFLQRWNTEGLNCKTKCENLRRCLCFVLASCFPSLLWKKKRARRIKLNILSVLFCKSVRLWVHVWAGSGPRFGAAHCICLNKNLNFYNYSPNYACGSFRQAGGVDLKAEVLMKWNAGRSWTTWNVA